MIPIAVEDGMGSGIGVQIVTQLRQELPLDVEILALGATAVATDRMMQAEGESPGRAAFVDGPPCCVRLAERAV